jgi:hypothetical protein
MEFPRFRRGVAQHPDSAERGYGNPLFTTGTQWTERQRAQDLLLLGPANLAGEIPSSHEILNEGEVGAAAVKLPAAPYPERLVHRGVEPVVRLLDIAILVRDASVIHGGSHAIVRHEGSIASSGRCPSISIERPDRGAQMIS